MNKKIIILIFVVGLILLSGFILWAIEKEKPSPKPPSSISTDREEAQKRLAQAKVAVLYERITDGVAIDRDVKETAKILKETHADFIFRVFWNWVGPVVESPDDIPPELVKVAEASEEAVRSFSETIKHEGYYYKNLENYLSGIKKEIPNLIFVGAIPVQIVGRIGWNPIRERAYGVKETWEMAFDPTKWKVQYEGKSLTKEQFQSWFYGIHPYGGTTAENYDWRKSDAYFPDITNPDYQELLLSWAKKQIDSGADAIWIDGLPMEWLFYPIVKDGGHPLLKDISTATSKIVDEIHKYGTSKGKYIYVGHWAFPSDSIEGFSYVSANVDFVTISPSKEEVLNKKLDETKWNKEIPAIRKSYGDIPVFAFIDWAFDESQTIIFSQKLSKEEQREVLRTFDESFTKMGVNFVYPIHGGYMGRGEITTKLAWGKYRIYDALASEFQTYETIRELAQKKAKGN